MIDPVDLAECRRAIEHGSRSFYAASKLLPRKVADPAMALYAFCRLADDAVDLSDEKAAAVLSLRDRLDLAYAGTPRDAAADRAFTAMIHDFDMPREYPEALLEGLAWDATDRRYASLSELRGYSARVASAVGAMMCVLMGVRDADALARACDLGVAMQLTNIARDVGEDAREKRLYLPLDWMEELGVDPDAFLANPEASPEIREITRRLLAAAEALYQRSEAGISRLPLSSRTGIYGARFIYAGIGRRAAEAHYDTVTQRARTSGREKVGLLAWSILRTVGSVVLPQSAILHARPLAEVAFLVDAGASTQGVASSGWGEGRGGAVVSILAQLEQRDRTRGTQPFSF